MATHSSNDDDIVSSSSQIHPIVDILACSGRIKATSGALESSHQALSIGCSFKAKYRSFVNQLNLRGVYNPPLEPKIQVKNPDFDKRV